MFCKKDRFKMPPHLLTLKKIRRDQVKTAVQMGGLFTVTVLIDPTRLIPERRLGRFVAAGTELIGKERSV